MTKHVYELVPAKLRMLFEPEIGIDLITDRALHQKPGFATIRGTTGEAMCSVIRQFPPSRL